MRDLRSAGFRFEGGLTLRFKHFSEGHSENCLKPQPVHPDDNLSPCRRAFASFCKDPEHGDLLFFRRGGTIPVREEDHDVWVYFPQKHTFQRRKKRGATAPGNVRDRFWDVLDVSA